MENAVEPFKLDEAFDYDNVVLTPKYTTAELNAFNQLIRENREKLQASICYRINQIIRNIVFTQKTCLMMLVNQYNYFAFMLCKILS